MKIARAFSPPEEETNVWPAITDTILLIASIFIIFSVLLLSMISLRRSDFFGSGLPGGELIASTYRIPEGILFESGGTVIRPGAVEALRVVLSDAAAQVPRIKAYVKNREWGDYFIVLEAAGHADYDPSLSDLYPGGDGNWDLSTSRANAVIHTVESILARDRTLARSLEACYGAKFGEALPGKTVLRASGYSSHLPCLSYIDVDAGSPGLIEKAKNRNRRVEIRLYAEPADILRIREKVRTR